MKHFTPLSDRSSQAHYFDNVHRTVIKPEATSIVPLPTYAATVALRSAAKANSGRFSHDPYGPLVVRESLYLTRKSENLDVSRESVASSTSSNSPLVVKAPIKRVYCNGRPVPVYTAAPAVTLQGLSAVEQA